MRLRIPMMVMCGLLVATAQAFGASRTDHDNCNAAEPDRSIAGCTRIIEDHAESEKTRAIAYVGRGLAWQAKGNRDQAMADFTDAIRLNPNDSLAYSNRGILWREKHDIDHAIADFSEAIRISPLPRSDLPGPGHVNIYANRGLAWQAKGDLDHALADFDQAISLDDKDAEAHYYRGQVYISKHDVDHAIADFDESIRLDPNRVDTYYLRGTARYDRYMFAGTWIEQTDLDGAIADFTEVIRRDAARIAAYRARAFAWNIHGDRERAIADLTEAVRLNPLNYEMIATLRKLNPDYQLPSIARDGILNWPSKK